MSIRPGATAMKDPDSREVYTFDWTDWLVDDAQLSTSTWTVSGPDAALTTDHAGIVDGLLKTRVRINGGTAGKTYQLTNRVTTDETPAQTDDRSITIRVVNR